MRAQTHRCSHKRSFSPMHHSTTRNHLSTHPRDPTPTHSRIQAPTLSRIHAPRDHAPTHHAPRSHELTHPSTHPLTHLRTHALTYSCAFTRVTRQPPIHTCKYIHLLPTRIHTLTNTRHTHSLIQYYANDPHFTHLHTLHTRASTHALMYGTTH